MKSLRSFFCFIGIASALMAAPQVIVLEGELTNTTADVSAPAQLVLTIEGAIVKAQLVTAAPLTGTGELAGVLENGWCHLQGTLEQGVTLRLRGGLNERDFRGTYLAAVPGDLVQYGRFHFTRKQP
ncbi:MAG: hypothetical protein IT582_09455 [Opitutaceae bacterium]|nr:hypothetical protein [Opitutaceae bacterium]